MLAGPDVLPSGNSGKFTYLILATHHARRTHALLHPTRASSNHSISLERLVILDVLCELGQRVARGRAIRATEERHSEITGRTSI